MGFCSALCCVFVETNNKESSKGTSNFLLIVETLRGCTVYRSGEPGIGFFGESTRIARSHSSENIRAALLGVKIFPSTSLNEIKTQSWSTDKACIAQSNILVENTQTSYVQNNKWKVLSCVFQGDRNSSTHPEHTVDSTLAHWKFPLYWWRPPLRRTAPRGPPPWDIEPITTAETSLLSTGAY